ncbi:MAG TPA: efflux transporter outer membrane subunit [Steroidobacteraceae bacterium]|nr:efflux transporter outer membrane subunit [Steroidobacteraceae bacterium]
MRPAVVSLSVAVLALAGCAVGPDYRAPQPVTPDEWHSVPPAGQAGAAAPAGDAAALADWWKTLNDPTLNELIERALASNKTAKQAYARVVEARARRGIAAADFWPTLGASAGGSRTNSEARVSNPDIGLSGGTDKIYDAGLDSAWELDLFGGKRRALEAATAQLGASEADLRDVLVTLLGDVALSYVDLRTAQSRLTFAEKNLEAQSGVLDITRWRSDAGLATVLDVEQAKSSYEQTRASIPSLQSSLAQAMNRLSVLTGDPPGSLEATLAERKPIPVAPLEVAAGVPADVLRRRPDIRSAERRLAAQTAEVGVATAALYPSLSLSGSITLQSLTASDVLNGFRTDRLGLSLSVPLFRGGALRQNVHAQNALVDQALAAYEDTVLAAYEEVENALTASTTEQVRHDALQLGVDSARRASELALTQYNSGLVDFQTVLTADRQLISLEDSLAVSDGERTANLIRLYKALGGGWSAFPKE